MCVLFQNLSSSGSCHFPQLREWSWRLAAYVMTWISGSAAAMLKANRGSSCARLELLIIGNPRVCSRTSSQESVHQADSLSCVVG